MRQEELRPKRSHSRDSSRSRTARRTRRRSAGALPRRAATDAMPATSTWTTWHGRRNRVHRAISDAITRDHAFWSYRPVSAPTMPGGSIGRCEPIPRCFASGTGRAEAERVPAAASPGTSVPRRDSAAGGWTSESSAAQMRRVIAHCVSNTTIPGAYRPISRETGYRTPPAHLSTPLGSSRWCAPGTAIFIGPRREAGLGRSPRQRGPCIVRPPVRDVLPAAARISRSAGTSDALARARAETLDL